MPHVAALAFLALVPFLTGVEERYSQTLELDPVELVAGRERPGREDLALVHGKYRYLFASEESRAAFAADPARYAIQMGGGCGRMGPLSGEGRTSIHAVWDERVFIFASETCRKTFLGAPEAFAGRPDIAPATSAASRTRALELLELAAKAMGGAERVDGLVSWRKSSRSERAADGKTVEDGAALTVRVAGVDGKPSREAQARADHIRQDQWWGDARYSNVATGAEGWSDEPVQGSSGRSTWPLDASQRAAVFELWARDPLALVRARNRADAVLAAEEPGRVGEAFGERVTLFVDGFATTLAIDPDSGRVLATAFRGRGPSLNFGKVERTYGDFAAHAGLELPSSYTVVFDGQRATSLDRRFDAIEVDGELPAGLFERPAR